MAHLYHLFDESVDANMGPALLDDAPAWMRRARLMENAAELDARSAPAEEPTASGG